MKTAKKKTKKTLIKKTKFSGVQLYHGDQGFCFTNENYDPFMNGDKWYDLLDILPDTYDQNGISKVGTFEFIVKFTPDNLRCKLHTICVCKEK